MGQGRAVRRCGTDAYGQMWVDRLPTNDSVRRRWWPVVSTKLLAWLRVRMMVEDGVRQGSEAASAGQCGLTSHPHTTVARRDGGAAFPTAPAVAALPTKQMVNSRCRKSIARNT